MRQKKSRQDKQKNKTEKKRFYKVVIVFFCLVVLLGFVVYLLLLSLSDSSSVVGKGSIITQSSADDQSEIAVMEGENLLNPDLNPTNNHVILHGPRNKKQIALTFDADMTVYMKQRILLHQVSGSFDQRILNILNKTNTKATFFMTGMWVELYPQITKSIANNQLFEIGSHSYSHQSFHGYCYGLGQLPIYDEIEEVGHTQGIIEEYTGITVQFFRFPGGCYDNHAVNVVNQANETVVHWDTVADDGFNMDTQNIINNIMSTVQNGSIIVMHCNGAPTAPKTADALPEIISHLKKEGYEFVKVNELLGLPEEARVSI